ncbi:MAG: hypothetical protein QG589_86 [Patescibacteria group bacterium]|nr:hypothetical protein [Patescibacteria group bacterium]
MEKEEKKNNTNDRDPVPFTDVGIGSRFKVRLDNEFIFVKVSESTGRVVSAPEHRAKEVDQPHLFSQKGLTVYLQ